MPSEDHPKEDKNGLPVDRGWAWVIVGAGTMLMTITVGGLKSNGLIIVEMNSHFENSTVKTNLWAINLIFILIMAVGPVASYLILKIGSRLTVIIGVLLMAASYPGLAYSTTPVMFFLLFSIPNGCGSGFIIITTLLLKGDYFIKWKGLATGIITSGGGLGSILIPQILRVLFDNLSFSGALLLYGGIALQGLWLAMLLRPISFYQRSPRKSEDKATVVADPKMVTPAVLDEGDGLLHSHHHNHERFDIVMGSCDLYTAQTPETTNVVTSHEEKPKKQKFKWRLIYNPKMLMICVSIWVYCMGFDLVFSCVPLVGESRGIPKTTVALLYAIAGALEIPARILHGIAADKQYIMALNQYILCLTVSGVSVFVTPLVPYIAGLTICLIGVQTMGIAVFGMMPLTLEEVLGKENVVTSMGIQAFFQGLSLPIATPIATYLYEMAGTWETTFYLMGAMMTAGGLICIPYSIFIWCLKLRLTQNQDDVNQGVSI